MKADLAGGNGTEPQPKYWAFISYSHKDERWGSWLHRSLERYAMPRRLIGVETNLGPIPRRIFPVFRDKEELPSAANLSAQVQDSLRRSRNLIVICSPNAASSRWVEQEILLFKKLGREDRIFALIIDGEPYSSGTPEPGVNEAFPRALRFLAAPDGQLSTNPAEPLAADVRDRKTSRRKALLRLIAGLLGIEFDTLVRRDTIARRWRVAQACALATLVIGIGTSAWYVQRREALHQAEVATLERLTQEAFGMIGENPTNLHTGVLLAIEAVHRAASLREPPEAALQLVRFGLSLLPTPLPWQLESAPLSLPHLEFSRDGRWVSAIDDSTMYVWETKSARLLGKFTLPGKGVGVAYPPKPGQVMALTAHGTQTWDIKAQALVSQRAFDADLSYGAALSKDGRWLAAPAVEGNGLRLVDLSSGANAVELPSEIPAHVVRFSTDGSQVVAAVARESNVGAQDAAVVIWDRATGRVAARYPHRTYIDGLSTSISPNARLIATVSGSNVRVIDSDTGRLVQTIQTWGGRRDEQTGSVALSSDGRWVAAGDGSQVRVWHVPTAKLVAALPAHAGVSAFSPNGQFLLTTDGKLWKMNSDAQLAQHMSELESVQSLAIGGNPPKLAHGSQAGQVGFWDLDSGIMTTIDEGPWSIVRDMDPEGRHLVVMTGTQLGDQWSARVWDGQAGRRIAELAPGGMILDAHFAPDGRTLWFLVEGRGVVAYDRQRYAELKAYPVHANADSLAFSADGERVLVAGGSKETVITVADAGGALAQHVDRKPTGPRGPWVLKESGAGEARILVLHEVKTGTRWGHFAQGVENYVSWGPIAQGVETYVVTSDQSRAVVLGQDGKIRVHWVQPPTILSEACLRVGRDLTEAEREKHLHQREGPPVCRPLVVSPS